MYVRSVQRNALAVLFLLSIFTAVGIFGVMLTDDLTVVLTWVWVGIGLSITYLLFQIAVNIEQLKYLS